MKKLIFWILFPFILIGSLFPPFPTQSKAVYADQTPPLPSNGDFACIVEDAYLYALPNENRGLFLLPKTYYVKLVEYGTEYSKVEYGESTEQSKKVVGYAKTQNLVFVDYQPITPYLEVTFTLTYRLEDAESTDPSFLTDITLSCRYYGDYKVGSKTYCYVLRGTQFGYVPKPITLTYPENTEYEEYLNSIQTSTPTTPTTPNTDQEKASPLQIGILVTLCLLVPLLAALIVKPPHRPPYETDE